MNIHSILAFTDFSAAGNAALARAALLASQHAARLSITYLPGTAEGLDLNICGLLHALADRLGRQHALDVHAIAPLTARHVEDAVSHAAWADLLVTAELPASLMGQLLFGRPLDKLLRRCQRPVLVVKRPALAPYRRVLVAVDFSAQADRLVDLAQHFGEGELELFHALRPGQDGALRHPEIPSHVVTAWRQAGIAEVRQRMVRLTDSMAARRNRVLATIGHGDPGRQAAVQQENAGADLLVVGKAPRSALSELIFGSVASRALRCAGGDVLVAPHGHARATKVAAVRRILPAPGVGAPAPMHRPAGTGPRRPAGA